MGIRRIGSSKIRKIEEDLDLIKTFGKDLESIKKALGIGIPGPPNVVDIKRQAAQVHEKLMRRLRRDPRGAKN